MLRRLFPVVLLALILPGSLPAQGPLPQLDFMGFNPGDTRREVESLLSSRGGEWRCASSRVDGRFSECRGTIQPDGLGELNVIGSIVNGTTAVLLIEGTVDDVELTRWVDDLSSRFGNVSARLANGQAMWQWTRQRHMIRVTTRIEQGVRMVSVSLVDGPVLDAL